MPNETWQSDFTHYPLTDIKAYPKGVEIITWLDDCTRYALHVSAHRAITTTIVKATFRKTAGQHGIPASTLTDNGMVYTVRLAGIGRQGGRNSFEQQLRDWDVVQKNGRPNHPRPRARSNASSRRSRSGSAPNRSNPPPSTNSKLCSTSSSTNTTAAAPPIPAPPGNTGRLVRDHAESSARQQPGRRHA
nr:DDE-type integrase/transposase/recombinase [Aeromicrobium sp. A1-2]